MKVSSLSISSIACCLLFFISFCFSCSGQKASNDDDNALLLQTIYDSPSLISLETSVQTVVVDSGQRWKEIFGNRITAIPIKANVIVSYDLKEIDSTCIRIIGRTAHIRLPRPNVEIQSSEILHNQIHTDVGLFRDKFSDAEEKEISHYGRDKIEQSLEELGLIDPARQQAQSMLTGIATRLGYDIAFDHPTAKQ